MCLTGSLLRSVLVAVLLAYSCGKSTCNYKEILGSYREVIFVELQNLTCPLTQLSLNANSLESVAAVIKLVGTNLTVSENKFTERDPCPSGKARRILVSIYGMTQQMRCLRSGKKQSDLEKPVESMEQLIVQNCSPQYLGKRASCSAVQKIRGKKRKRMRLIRVIKALITCWQKLQSVYVLSK